MVLVPGVFVEFESLSYIVISLLEEFIFPVYLSSLCRCIPCLTRRHRHFRLCIWAEGWYRQQSKGRGHGLKTWGEASPPNHKHKPPAGVDQAKCVGPRQDKRALFLASRTHTGWMRGPPVTTGVKGARRNHQARDVPWPTSLTPTKLWGRTS